MILFNVGISNPTIPSFFFCLEFHIVPGFIKIIFK